MVEEFKNPWIEWRVWSRIEVARVYEFAALFADVDPDDVRIATSEFGPPREWNFNEALQAEEQTSFLRTFQLALAGLKAQTLPRLNPDDFPWAATEVRRRDFLQWAESLNLNIPPPMKEHDAKSPSDAPASADSPLGDFPSVTEALKAFAVEANLSEVDHQTFKRLAMRAGCPLPKADARKRGKPAPVPRPVYAAALAQFKKERELPPGPTGSAE